LQLLLYLSYLRLETFGTAPILCVTPCNLFLPRTARTSAADWSFNVGRMMLHHPMFPEFQDSKTKETFHTSKQHFPDFPHDLQAGLFHVNILLPMYVLLPM
jgi:hypothetical protein